MATSPSPIAPRVWLTPRQAAAHIGISYDTIRKWISTGRHRVPCFRVGRVVRFDRDALDRWLMRGDEGRAFRTITRKEA